MTAPEGRHWLLPKLSGPRPHPSLFREGNRRLAVASHCYDSTRRRLTVTPPLPPSFSARAGRERAWPCLHVTTDAVVQAAGTYRLERRRRQRGIQTGAKPCRTWARRSWKRREENDLGVRVPGREELPGLRGPLETGFREWGGLEAHTVPPGGPAKDKDHAGHSGRCVLQVGSER